MRYTILGAEGFIGSNLVNYLEKNKIEYFVPTREHVFKNNENLGHVIYCIGVTADFRSRPIDTVNAHVCKLIEVLENANFDSFLYLSSTRIYQYSEKTEESSDLMVNPNNFGDLYNISKLMGESICLSYQDKKIKVARLSNVVGSDFNSENFVYSLIREAVNDGLISLEADPGSEKDYVSIQDVVAMLVRLSGNTEHRVYNIASGINITNSAIISEIEKVTNCVVESSKKNNPVKFPVISIDRAQKEFKYEPLDILNKIGELVREYKMKTNRND